MKCTVVIQNEREEVVIYARERTALVEKIEKMLQGEIKGLMGYDERSATPLQPEDIVCVTTQGGKVFALTQDKKWQLKLRLYQAEQELPEYFVKINQSCLANIKKIQRFHTTFGGTLQVIFQNGYVDYVSRRQLKTVKERLGL
jgi:DNA-binding LytR/AlgR family response regulator